MFEVVSAYGTVGLSLGSPNANYSLCGDFRTLSKLILCAVMIRGRHRGLPVAIEWVSFLLRAPRQRPGNELICFTQLTMLPLAPVCLNFSSCSV